MKTKPEIKTNPENTATITLPESGLEVTLRRAGIMHWIQRGRTPQWYAHLYLQRGQGTIDEDAMGGQVSQMDAAQLYEIMQFHDFLVEYAVNKKVDLDELPESDYNFILRYAQTGSTKNPKDAKAEEVDEPAALETFRAKR